MSNQKKKIKIINIVFYFFILILLFVVIAFILRFTNGGTDDFKTFYVTDVNNNIFATNDSVVLPCNAVTRFNVGYTFDKNDKGYTVKVVPNVTTETEFEYTVDGEGIEYGFEDFTSAFNVEKYDDYFTLVMPSDMSEIIQSIYSGKTVTIPTDLNLSEQFYFKLVVTSYSGKNEITIFLKAKPYYFILTPNAIVF